MFIVFKLFGTFFFVTKLIYTTDGDLSDDKFIRVRRVTAGLKIKKNCLNKYFYPMFMIRRTVYVMIPVIFKGY